MAGFNRFGSGGIGSLYAGINTLQQPSGITRRDDRFDNRRNSRESGFDRRGDRGDFGRRDPSPRRRRYSPDPPYSGIRGSRQDERGGLGSYSMDDLGRDSFNRNRGFTSQLAQQQQQLMAMVQTQSLLAAIQAQASAAAKRGGSGMQPPSLMQGMRMHDNRGGRMGDRQNRKRRMSPPRGQRNANQSNYRQRRSQQNRQQGNRANNQQRRDYDKDRNRTSEASRKSEDKEPVEEPYVEETLDDEAENDEEETKQETVTSDETKEASKKTEPSTEKATKSQEQKSASQSEDQEFKSEFNLAGQNVNSLVKSLYDNSRGKYVCKVCKIMCTKETCFKQHLYGKRHVKTWLESRGQSFEAEMFKRASEEAAKSIAAKEQAKVSKEKAEQDRQQKTEQAPDEKQEIKDEESVETKEPTATGSSEEETTVKEEPVEINEEKSPPPEPKKVLVKEEKMPVKIKEKVPIKEEKFEAVYSCDTRKVAIKEGEVITISSITEARVRLVGFDKGLNTQGCEFVKAVSGFNCRLCKTFILNGSDVMKHVQGKKHQAKYKRYISEHPKYESNQIVRNNELSEMLSEREGEELLLYEVIETEEPKRPYRYSSSDTMDVQVTKYVVAEDEPDDRMEDDLDESHSDLLKEDMDESASNEKKDDVEDDSHNDVDGEDKDLESTEMENNVMLTPGDLDEKYDPDLGTDISEPTTEENIEEVTEAKDDPNTSIDSLTESQEEEDEPVEKKVKLATPTGRRGRRAARGAQARGRGRGRGGKRSIRQNVNTTPKQETPTADQNNDDENFMDGYEVIDEVVDDE